MNTDIQVRKMLLIQDIIKYREAKKIKMILARINSMSDPCIVFIPPYYLHSRN